MTYILGIDGGGSKTAAVLADESGSVLGVGRAGNGNHQASDGLIGAMREVRVAGLQAMDAAGIQPTDVAAACYCLAGADLPEDFALLRPALEELRLAQCIDLHNDSIAALRSGSENPNAVTVIVGSGTNAAGRNALGDEIRLAALGWYSGDYGGGGDLARDAIWSVARAQDGRGPHTTLEGLVLSALGVATAEDMIARFYLHGVPRDEVLALAPLVFQAAKNGDVVAGDLVVRQGQEVAVTAAALLRRLNLLDTPADVVLGGSIFKGEGSLLMDTIVREMRAGAPLARVVRPNVEPVIGALFCGMDMLGIPVNEEVRTRAQQSHERLMQSRQEVSR